MEERKDGPPDLSFQDLSPYTGLFRNRLIEEFQLLDNITDSSTTQAPQYTSRIVRDEKFFRKILVENPHQLIKFQPLKRTVQEGGLRRKDRRLTRARNLDRLPVGAWAAWVVESNAFQRFLIALVLCNSVSAALMAEWQEDQRSHWQVLQAFALFDLVSVVFYSLEIALKWLDDFEGFWKDSWNVFDLLVTVASGIPSVLEVMYGAQNGGFAHVLQELRAFRIVRTLKVIVRFGNLKIVILTILQTMRSMAVILILMLMAGFIFGIVAFNVFTAYSHSPTANPDYSWGFSTLEMSLFSTFRLMTFDQWDLSSKDLALVVHPAVVYAWYMIWLWLGGFIFRNIFVGVVVTEFQRIQVRMNSQHSEYVKQKKFQKMRNRLNKELNVRGDAGVSEGQPTEAGSPEQKTMFAPDNVSPRQPADLQILATDEMQHDDNAQPVHTETASQNPSQAKNPSISAADDWLAGRKWDDVVQETMNGLQGEQAETRWPRDTLFKYFQLMETIQENLKEFEELQNVANTLLLGLHDE